MNRLEEVRELGVHVQNETEWVGEVGKDRHEVVVPDKVRGIEAPFTPEDWMSIAQREGDHYIGGCCANMSLLQDEINGVFRDGGYIDANTLLRIADAARGHDGFENFAPVDDEGFARLVSRWKKAKVYTEDHPGQNAHLDPWFKLAVAFNAVEPFLTPMSMDTVRVRYPHDDDDRHFVRQLAGAMQSLDFSDLFHNDSDAPEEKDQHAASRRLKQAKVLVPMRRLLTLLEEQEWPFEGWALVEEGTNDMLSLRGPCLYSERGHAEKHAELFARYRKNEEERQAKRKPRDDEVEPFWMKIHPELVQATVQADGDVSFRRREDWRA